MKYVRVAYGIYLQEFTNNERGILNTALGKVSRGTGKSLYFIASLAETFSGLSCVPPHGEERVGRNT